MIDALDQQFTASVGPLLACAGRGRRIRPVPRLRSGPASRTTFGDGGDVFRAVRLAQFRGAQQVIDDGRRAAECGQDTPGPAAAKVTRFTADAWSCCAARRTSPRPRTPRCWPASAGNPEEIAAVPELHRLGRNIAGRQDQLLAYFTTTGTSNSPTEAVHLLCT